MFLRRITVKQDGKAHAYWARMESVRTARGPRQRTVAYLGELGAAEQAGWAEVRRLLDRQPLPAATLFADPGAAEPVPEHITVNVRGVRVERTRDFGRSTSGGCSGGPCAWTNSWRRRSRGAARRSPGRPSGPSWPWPASASPTANSTSPRPGTAGRPCRSCWASPWMR